MVFSISTATGAAMLDLKRLLLFYPCDESGGDVLTDASGHGWDGDVANASWEKGVFGNAVRLEKTSSTAQGDIISSTVTTEEISIMCWVNMKAHSNYNGLISIASPACEAQCCYRLMINPAKNPFWNAGHHVDKSLANFTFDLDTWYHCAMVINSETTKIYIDGEFVGEQAENFPPPDLGEVSVYIGAGETATTWQAENLLIDEVMIWDIAFEEEDMKIITQGSKIFMAVEAQGKLATTWASLKIR